MPSATKLIAALLFACLGYGASWLALPLLDDLDVIAFTPEINAGLSFLVGWFFAAPRVGGGRVEGISNGITTTAIGLLLVLVVHGWAFAMRTALAGRYDQPIEAIEVGVEYLLQSGQRIATLDMALVLLIGGAAIGLLLEATRPHSRLV